MLIDKWTVSNILLFKRFSQMALALAAGFFESPIVFNAVAKGGKMFEGGPPYFSGFRVDGCRQGICAAMSDSRR